MVAHYKLIPMLNKIARIFSMDESHCVSFSDSSVKQVGEKVCEINRRFKYLEISIPYMKKIYLLLLLISSPLLHGTTIPPEKDECIIVFHGDSTTDAGRIYYSDWETNLGQGYVSMLSSQLQNPQHTQKPHIYNRAFPNSSLRQISLRWQKDSFS